MPMRPPEETLVLVVDDHALNLELLRQDLGEAGYRVSTARSGPEALAQIEREPPHIVLLDIMMPVLSGLEVLRRLRATPATADLPVILVTAKSQSRDVVEGLRAGANDYVTKPIDRDVLLARMETHLRIKSLQEEVEARNERIRRDLQEARRLQISLMPDEQALESLSGSYGVRLAACNRTAEIVGGDFWDVLNVADGSLGLILADFRGTGLLAALNTYRLKTFLHSACAGISNPGLAMARLNAHFARDPASKNLATCLYGLFAPREHRMSLAVAGHPSPLLFRRREDRVTALAGGGHALGLFLESDFQEYDIALDKGDVLLFFTDGLMNLPDRNGEALGAPRLHTLLHAAGPEGARPVRDNLLDAINERLGDAPPPDDLTFIALELVD